MKSRKHQARHAGVLYLLLPFGLLVSRSGFIPRILGVLLIVGCFADVAVSATSLLFPAYEHVVQPLRALGVGEILIILWLLIKGARNEPSEELRPAPALGGPSQHRM